MGASPATQRRQERDSQRAAVADAPKTRDAFTLIIPGAPIGFARMRTGNGRTFIPDRQRNHMDAIRTEWIAAGRPCLRSDCHYRVSIRALHERTTGHFLRDGSLSAEGRRRPFPGAPDIDNIGKLLLDALVAAGAVPDDRRMVGLDLWKRWVVDGEHAQVWCSVEVVEP